MNDNDLIADFERGVRKGKKQRKPYVRPVKTPGSIAATTRRAKELFLYGNGDGKPVCGIAILSEKSGAAPRTLEKWLPVWEKERIAIARATSGEKGIYRKTVALETLELHEAGVEALRQEVVELKKLLLTLTRGSEMHRDALKLYTVTLKAWTEQSGLQDHYETQATAAREMMKLAIRQRGKDAGEQLKTVPGFSFDVPLVLESGPEKNGNG